MTLSVERSGELANRFPVVAGHVDIILEREVAREVIAHVHEVLRSCYRIVDVGHCDVERDGLSTAESVALCRQCNGRLAQRDEVERGAAHLNSRRIGACDAHLATQCRHRSEVYRLCDDAASGQVGHAYGVAVYRQRHSGKHRIGTCGEIPHRCVEADVLVCGGCAQVGVANRRTLYTLVVGVVGKLVIRNHSTSHGVHRRSGREVVALVSVHTVGSVLPCVDGMHAVVGTGKESRTRDVAREAGYTVVVEHTAHTACTARCGCGRTEHEVVGEHSRVGPSCYAARLICGAERACG